MYTLKGEKTELADRANERQVGTVPRHKVSAVKSVTELFSCSYAIGLSGSLSGVHEGGAMLNMVFVTASIVHSRCVIR